MASALLSSQLRAPSARTVSHSELSLLSETAVSTITAPTGAVKTLGPRFVPASRGKGCTGRSADCCDRFLLFAFRATRRAATFSECPERRKPGERDETLEVHSKCDRKGQQRCPSPADCRARAK